MAPGVGGAAAVIPFDADELIATAQRATGLHDFGPPTWEEPFRRLVASLGHDAQLHVLGRLMSRHDVLRHLCTRLLVIDARHRNPAIADEAIVAPIFITGPARSGTSILHELLAQDPQLRAPFAWEMAYPIAPPPGQADERLLWAESEFDLWGDVSPEFNAVHELAARLPEECLWLMAPEFDPTFWTTCTDIGPFLAWRAQTDPRPIYDFHKKMLQLLQHGTVARPWVLKSPGHLGRLQTVFAVYPDARVIHTHRDPARVLPSTVSTLAAGRRVRSDAVDANAIAGTVGFGLRRLLDSAMSVRASGTIPDGRIADLHYLDLLRDPQAAIRGAYQAIDLPFDAGMAERVRAYLAARPQDKHGVHRYRAADYGLDTTQIHRDFAAYLAHYGIETEPEQ
jgi:hypothetical protein